MLQEIAHKHYHPAAEFNLKNAVETTDSTDAHGYSIKYKFVMIHPGDEGFGHYFSLNYFCIRGNQYNPWLNGSAVLRHIGLNLWITTP